MGEKHLEKCIVDYYSCLLKIDDKSRDLIKSVERPLISLKNEAEQLRLVSDCSVNEAEICGTDQFRGKLVFKINVAIEDEISLIIGISSQLNNACQVLKNKFEKLEAARSKANPNSPDMKELVAGTALRPRLDLLMEWAIDSSNYYIELNSRINRCLKNVDCKNEETVVNLTEAFNQDKTKRAKIERILGFTQFLAKET